MLLVCAVFFFKQKTAYEMRISDWSSDVCSSDLSSDRIAQMVGSGLLTFIDRATGYNQIFDEDELAFYSTEAELTSRLEYFIRNDAERRRVAEAGWGAYRALFDVERVAHYIVGVAMEDIDNSEEHKTELQSLMLIWADVYCL